MHNPLFNWLSRTILLTIKDIWKIGLQQTLWSWIKKFSLRNLSCHWFNFRHIEWILKKESSHFLLYPLNNDEDRLQILVKMIGVASTNLSEIVPIIIQSIFDFFKSYNQLIGRQVVRGIIFWFFILLLFEIDVDTVLEAFLFACGSNIKLSLHLAIRTVLIRRSWVKLMIFICAMIILRSSHHVVVHCPIKYWIFIYFVKWTIILFNFKFIRQLNYYLLKLNFYVQHHYYDILINCISYRLILL